MGFLQPLEKDIGYLKSGWQGSTGSGKTTTAALVAIGLHRYLKLKSPVAFFDSERGSGFVHDLFKRAKIELVGVRSRSFKDLVTFMRETEKEKIDIDIIDSISHPWREILTAYKLKSGRKFVDIRDWGPIKEEWHRGFTVPYINSKLHILMCGREANVFEDVEDDDDESTKKKWKAIKVGTKMSTEGETGYEPNILVEMAKELIKDGGAYARVANVLKDRSFRLDGARTEFEMPMGKDGLPDITRLIEENKPFQFCFPHIQCLDAAAGAVAVGVSMAPSTEVFDTQGQTNRAREEQEKELLLGNIETLLHKYYPARDKLSLKAKGDIIEGSTAAIGKRTRNWEAVKQFQLDSIKVLYSVIDELLSPPSKAELQTALKLGVDSKGEIVDADAAAPSIKALCTTLLKGKPGQQQLVDDLPF